MTTTKRSFRNYLSGIVSAFNPPSPPPMDHVLSELLASLRIDLENEIDAKDELLHDEIRQEENSAQRKVLSDISTWQSRNNRDANIYSSLGKIARYSTSTIQMIHDALHGTGKLTRFIDHAPDNEASVRSAMAFPNSGTECLQPNEILDDVRRATTIVDLSELTVGSDEHDLVTAVVEVARGVAINRQNAYFGQYTKGVPASHADASNVSKWLRKERTRRTMTTPLATVILRNPDRVDDIITYCDNRDIESIDPDHLQEYLKNASVALSSGVL